jgi:DNA-binding NarL/FixJ family response regulator
VTISVLLADDQAMVRGGLRLILEDQPDIVVLGEAVDGAEAVELARRLRPDVCLVDIRMPRLDGIEVTRALAGPGVADPLRVVVVTTFDLDEYVHGALLAGAVGFVLKDAGPTLLVEAVRAAHAGDALISPSITLRLLRQFARTHAPGARGAGRGTGRPGPPSQPPSQPLSARETEVIRAIARGRTNQEIAAALFISLSTVKSHLASVQAKLRLRNRVEIAAWAWESRLMDTD